MKLEGTYEFEAPRQLVWDMLQNPEVIGSIIPGGSTPEEVSENHYQMVMEVKVGPVSGRFESNIELADLNEPESYRMTISGSGPPGFVKGTGDIQLEAVEEAKTVMNYTGDAQVGGRVASVGQRLLDMTAKAITKQSLNMLAKRIKKRIEELEKEGGSG
jgi:carbon monoxide dehydrogenase subunit G